MYSIKTNVLELTALMKQHGITRAVLSPGSRNSPLNHTLASCPDILCTPVTDERSAAFTANGLCQALRRPVAACCTSGTALLDMAPAVAEAYYQNLPLLIISADRPASAIGQMDGQTIVQPGSLICPPLLFPKSAASCVSRAAWPSSRLTCGMNGGRQNAS